MPLPLSLKARVVPAGIHLACSVLVAGLVWLLVFKFWYPAPFDAIAKGAELFLLLVGVDVVIGPTLTAVIAGPSKPRQELARDMSVIVLLQVAALSYGIYTMALARPIGIVFEMDLFRVVVAVDVDASTLHEAPPSLRSLSWDGPRLFAAVKPTDPQEQLRTIQLGMAQIPLSSLPRYWRDYAAHRDRAWQTARPLSLMLERHSGAAADASAMAKAAGHPLENLKFLPLVSRQAAWTAVLAPGAKIIGYLEVDPFL